MVQIYGSSPPKKLNKGDKTTRTSNSQLLVPDKSSGLSSPPVIVHSKKDFPDPLKK